MYSLGDGALVTGSDWLWVLERRGDLKERGNMLLIFDFQVEVYESFGGTSRHAKLRVFSFFLKECH